MWSRVSSSVLVIVVPLLLLAAIGLVTGGGSIGVPEALLLAVVWVVGLAWVWRPGRKHKHQA